MKKEYHIAKTSKFLSSYFEVGQGYPLVFLHGFLRDSSVWNEIVDILGEDYRCICLDLLGFGKSEKPDIDYTIDLYANYIDDFINHLNLKEFILIGHSFGGWVTAAYAIKNPNPGLRRIVLMSPGGIRDDSFNDNYKYIVLLLKPNKIIDFLLYLSYPLFLVLGQKNKWNHMLKARRAFKEQPVASSFFLKKLKGDDPRIDTVDHLLHDLNVSTLVISGEQDKVIPLWHAKTYVDNVSDSHAMFIADAGHDLFETHARQVSQKIHEFISYSGSVAKS